MLVAIQFGQMSSEPTSCKLQPVTVLSAKRDSGYLSGSTWQCVLIQRLMSSPGGGQHAVCARYTAPLPRQFRKMIYGLVYGRPLFSAYRRLQSC